MKLISIRNVLPNVVIDHYKTSGTPLSLFGFLLLLFLLRCVWTALQTVPSAG